MPAPGFGETRLVDAPTPADHGRTPPLSLAQERVLFYDLVAPTAPFHNVPRLISIRGPLVHGLLERAMNRVVERHAILRCTYHVVDGVLEQRLHDRMDVRVPVVDLRHLNDEAREAEVDRLSNELVGQAFDIATGPLIRATLIRTGDEEHVFYLDFHHVTCDGWSERVTLNEICALYEAYRSGSPDPLAPLEIQYFDYAQWQRRRLLAPASRRHHDYWRGKLGPDLPVLDLPYDRPRPARREYVGASLGYELSPRAAARLREFARHNNCTPYMVALSVFFVLLHRYTQQTDLVIGSPVNNRERADLHDLIGYFVTRLPLRADLSGAPRFDEFLARTRRTVLEAFEHKETTAERWPYPREGSEVRDSSNYQVMFFYQENPVGVERRFADLVMTNANAHSGRRVDTMGLRSPTLGSQLDIGFFLEPVGDRVFGWIEYDTALFDRATIQRMRGHYLRLLDAAIDAPETPVDRLEMLDHVQRDMLAPPLATDDGPVTAAAALPALFDAQAVRSPEATALSEGEQRWTFDALRRRSNALAHRIVAERPDEGDTVAVVLPRGAAQLMAVLGVLKSGGVCLPLDPDQPGERLRRVLDQAGCRFAVTGEDTPLPPRVRGIEVDPNERDTPPDVLLSPDEPAFLFLTSGTTGSPKLVEIGHRAAVGQQPEYAPYRLDSDDVLLCTTPPGSVRLLGECFWPWLAGAQVAIAPGTPTPRELLSLVERHRVTVMSVIPSFLRQLLDEPDAARAGRLRILQILGEPLPAELHGDARSVLEETQLVNSYAQTEACPGLFWHSRTPESHTAPVQQKNRMVVGYVLDRNLSPVPKGVPGDLYMAGATVALGYRNSPEETTAAFVPDPYSGFGGRMFRTGDRARLLDDGLIEILGRTDNRVKVQGHSVAPEEVERVVLEHPDVRDALVTAVSGEDGDRRLSAYVTSSGSPDLADVRAHTARRLPVHMVPAWFTVMDELPTTATGKLDRTADLPSPGTEWRPTPVEPRSELEQQVADVWSEILGNASFGVFDTFHEAGGNSLMGIRLVSRLNRAFDTGFTVRMLLEHPTVAGIAARLEGNP
ncbi:hypothetical protein CQJ94_11330 [Glycomyces fuscus]|nr:hypothetical protein CQJ94_11330 [Glycomyces fuscus]